MSLSPQVSEQYCFSPPLERTTQMRRGIICPQRSQFTILDSYHGMSMLRHCPFDILSIQSRCRTQGCAECVRALLIHCEQAVSKLDGHPEYGLSLVD